MEDGSIADNAKVIVSFSATPAEGQSPWLALFLDCQISFGADLLRSNLDGGLVSVDPTDASFRSRDADCDRAKAAWDHANKDKRDVLGRLRVVQLSFWGFERAPEDPSCACAIQIDGVALSHATTVAEEAASGNLNTRVAPSVWAAT